MYYREQLKKARKYDIEVISLLVANEVDCLFDFEMTEQEFEKCCALIETSFLYSRVSVRALARALCDIIEDNQNKSINELIDSMKHYDLMHKAYCYE